LHQVGFAQPPRHRDAGALLPHHFTLAGPPFTWDGGLGRFVSVALSRGFPRVDRSTTLPFDVRTFLEGKSPPRLPDLHSSR
jgi:hypothetical protein